jgi:hypothetical protein
MGRHKDTQTLSTREREGERERDEETEIWRVSIQIE